VTLTESPAALNAKGLEWFAAGQPDQAERLLRQAYRLMPDEPAILVNLGLALIQQGLVEPAERCYRLALHSRELRVRRSAAKNLGFLNLWLGDFERGWRWHRQRFAGEAFETSQWQGEPLNGQWLTVWNDVGMGDAFQFARYTLPLVQRGEKVRWAVHQSQLALFRNHLAWPLGEVVDRNTINRETIGPHIPLMGLIPVLDPDTRWGRSFSQPTWQLPAPLATSATGLCWASNPGDRTMHAYKSSQPERLLQLLPGPNTSMPLLSLQTDEPEAHGRLGLAPASKNWLTTLQQIGRCDQVLSVDTAVAHLAAGAGKPVQLLLGTPPDWRWRQFPGNQNLWYQGLRTLPLRGCP